MAEGEGSVMASLPEPIHQTVGQVLAWYERQAALEGPRPYLGGSEIGNPCERALWLSFRWAKLKKFDGRMLRLFNTGHREEPRIVNELRAIGCQVWDTDPKTGNQWEVVGCSGHMKGHLDAKILGLPEAPKTAHLGEFKTHNEKSFKELKDKGLAKAKPKHLAQMIYYMGKEKLERGLYYAVNKNTDEIYVERIEFDRQEFERLEARGARVIAANEPPPRISERESWYECKLCDYHSLCHGTEAPQANCRTCAHSTPVDGGTWTCEQYNCDLPYEGQRAGCDSHRYIPILLERFAVMTGVADGDVLYENKATGEHFTNGATGYLSREIHRCTEKAILGDKTLARLRTELNAEIIA